MEAAPTLPAAKLRSLQTDQNKCLKPFWERRCPISSPCPTPLRAPLWVPCPSRPLRSEAERPESRAAVRDPRCVKSLRGAPLTRKLWDVLCLLLSRGRCRGPKPGGDASPHAGRRPSALPPDAQSRNRAGSGGGLASVPGPPLAGPRPCGPGGCPAWLLLPSWSCFPRCLPLRCPVLLTQRLSDKCPLHGPLTG